MNQPGSRRISRGKRGLVRCPACALPLALCLCAEAQQLSLDTSVLVFRHRREVHKPTNTARLVPLTLTHAQVHVVGLPEDRVNYAQIQQAHRLPLLLSPTPTSVPLTADIARSTPITLVVPDGNWRQTRKMAQSEPEMRALLAVHLPPGPPRRFELRKHPEPDRLSTFEAIARALGILEGSAVQIELERILALHVERILCTRGIRPAADEG